jgi:dipeptidyl aminopeptidase/acylaminoacyl peptidase
MKLTICIFAMSLSSAHGTLLHAESRKPVNPVDCITVRYLLSDHSYRNPVQVSPAGNRVAYLVRTPNLETNNNDISLYVAELGDSNSASGKPLLTGSTLSQAHWLRDGKQLAVLVEDAGRVVVALIDVETGVHEVIARSNSDIVEYSIDANGEHLAFVIDKPFAEVSNAVSESEAAHGYRIPFHTASTAFSPDGIIYTSDRVHGHKWSTPKLLKINSPINGQALESYPYYDNLHLSVSPDGGQLLFTYRSGIAPDQWRKSPVVRDILDSGSQVMITILQDLSNGTTRLLVNAPFVYSLPLWAPDSTSFAFVGLSPVGSQWEAADIREHRRFGTAAHLFSINIRDEEVREITERLATIGAQPLFWGVDGNILVRTSKQTITEFHQTADGWKPTRSYAVPFKELFSFSRLASNGRWVAGDYQDIATPPELFEFQLGKGEIAGLIKLNPQLDVIEFSPSEEVRWTLDDGYQLSGILFTPPHYDRGARYPLVIQTKPYEGGFVCDYGEADYPSFCPQPLASAGIMYLARMYPSDWKQADDAAHYPKGYPGQIAEAAFQTKMWDAAVDALANRKLIDPLKVGIIGFSRSGWYTEFALAHGKTAYAAATAADNVQYSPNEYWLLHSDAILHGWESMYGGPPVGDSLKTWVQYSAPFTLDKIHTPLLIEVMGYGVAYTNQLAPPSLLANHFDLLTGLNQLRAVLLSKRKTSA